MVGNKIWNPAAARPVIRKQLEQEGLVRLALFDELTDDMLWIYIMNNMGMVDQTVREITDFFTRSQREQMVQDTINYRNGGM